MEVIIEQGAGFCFGVVRAVNSMEKLLQEYKQVYSLGEPVHNTMEVERLKSKGMQTISHEEFKDIKNSIVMIRAHGESPLTYSIAEQNNITLIDATCPIVLKLQKNIRQGYKEMKSCGGQIVIFGKKGHAEVVGLNGQTENTSIIVSNEDDLSNIDMSKPIHIYSQTTKSREDYMHIISLIKERHKTGEIFVSDSICSRVSQRAKNIGQFAKSVECVIFVSGKDSSNGKYLYNLCKKNNEHSFFVSSNEDIHWKDIKNCSLIGITGANSTPLWQMEKIKQMIDEKFSVF